MADDEVEIPVPKGSYNIDFDALDDSFNPFASGGKKIRNSPPLEEQIAKSAPVTQEENGKEVTGDAEKEVKEPEGSNVDVAPENTVSPSVVNTRQDAAASDSSPPVVVEKKPVKKKGTKVVKKPKSRPVSKNLEDQVSADAETPKPEEPPSSEPAVAPPAEGDTNCPPVTSPPTQEVQEHGDAPPTADTTTTTPEQSPQPVEGSDSKDATPKREKTGVKVKKSKHKTRRRSGSRSEATDALDGVRRDSEGRDSGAEHTEREVRGSSRSSASSVSGESQVGHDRALAAGEGGKTKHPAARVLEQQVQGESTTHHADSAHSASLGKQCPEADSSFESFYDAYDSPPDGSVPLVPEMENFTEMEDSHVLFQSQDYIHGLSWSHDDDTLLDEGAGEARVADDLSSGESEMADSHHTNESVVKLVQDSPKSGQVKKYSQSDWNKLKQELELGFQAQLLAKEREWGAKLADRDSRIAVLDDTNKKLRQTNEDMRVVVAEFEKTISQLQSEKEKTSNASQQSLQDVVKERDQALEDLQSVETAFSDLHRRYEKTKAVVEGFKQNEEVLKKCVADLQSKLKKAEQKVQSVKSQAEEKLEKATEEIEKAQKASTSEIARLEAALRKADLQLQSQETLLEQKVKENKELAAICDELIAKVQ